MPVRVKICGITRAEDAKLAVELGAAALGFNFYRPSPRYIAPQAAAEIICEVLPWHVAAVGVFADETDPDHVLAVAREAGVSALQLHGATPELMSGLGISVVIPAEAGIHGSPAEELGSSAEGRDERRNDAEGRGFSPAVKRHDENGASAPEAKSGISRTNDDGLQRLKPQALIGRVTARLKPRPSGVANASQAGNAFLDQTAGWPLPLLLAASVDAAFDPAKMQNVGAWAILLDAYHPVLRGGTGQTIDWTQAREATRYARIILAGGLTPENVGEAIRHVRPFAVDVASGVESSPGVKDATKLREFFTAVRECD